MIKMIFVYGSLMTDFWNYNKFLKDHVIHTQKATITGTLYHIENKGYPAYIKEGSTSIHGEILSIDNYQNLIGALDCLEGYHKPIDANNEYNRRPVPVTLLSSGHTLELDVYVYNHNSPRNQHDHLSLIPHGNWRKYMVAQASQKQVLTSSL